MLLHRRSFLAVAAACTLPLPALAQPAFDLGSVWRVREVSPGNADWIGRWIRRGGSPVFDASWYDRISGQRLRDVVEFERLRGDQVVLYRRGINGRYFGPVGQDGRSIRGGTASWYDRATWWSADIEG